MSAPCKAVQNLVSQPPPPLVFESRCLGLSRTGQAHPQRIVSVIEQVAPSPGQIVYLHTTKLAMRLGGLQPVIFSAIDAATHLQVAQANFAMTSAAALLFVDFVAHSFPFPISEIRTRKELPFHNPKDNRPHRDFPTLIGDRGYAHSFLETHSSDALFSITSKMLFGGLSEGQAFPASAYELQRALAQFLTFHNNFRFVPWLQGKTPMQKLKTFKSFQRIHSFSLPDEVEEKLQFAERNSPDARDLRSNPANDFRTNHMEVLSRRTK